MYRQRLRTLLLVLTPIILSGCLSIMILAGYMNQSLDRQANQFGQSLVDQAALSLADYLVNDDMLSLNVVLSELNNRNQLAFTSVYGADNQLLAQTGNRANASRFFSRDIAWQNASLGYVQLGMNDNQNRQAFKAAIGLVIAAHMTIALIAGLLVWFCSDLLYIWVALPAARTQANEDADIPQLTVAAGPSELAPPAVLIIKLRPARLAPDYLPIIEQALNLYGGHSPVTEGDNLVMQFHGDEPACNAVCSGLLVLEIFRQLERPITISAGLDTATASAGASISLEDIDNCRKHASYLASMADNAMLASEAVMQTAQRTGQFRTQPFHSSLSPDGQVHTVMTLDTEHQQLLASQARQLLKG